MDTRQPFKDVSIKDRRYRIGRFTAMNGSWIAMQIMTKLLPLGVEKAAGLSVAATAPRTEMSEAEFNNLQRHCLAVCARYDTVGTAEVAMPVLMESGAFALKDLEYDLNVVMVLTAEALGFNVASFFQEDTLNRIFSILSSTSQSSVSK